MFSKTVIIGNVAKKPELKGSKAGTNYCNFTVGVNIGYGDKKKTDWFDVTAFGKTAETCAQHLDKGYLVCVNGTIHLNQYEAKDKTIKSRLELAADDVRFLSKPKSAEGEARPVQVAQSQDDIMPDFTGESIPF